MALSITAAQLTGWVTQGRPVQTHIDLKACTKGQRSAARKEVLKVHAGLVKRIQFSGTVMVCNMRGKDGKHLMHQLPSLKQTIVKAIEAYDEQQRQRVETPRKRQAVLA